MAQQSSRRRTQTKRKNDLATQRFYFLIAMLALILIFAVASLVLWIAAPREKKPVKTDGGVFSVKTITVEGNTTYQNNAVVGESGILIGQSIFAVDSNAVEEHLLKTFPYFSAVEV
ncbi:MAG: FtsQ-type POTRA domain-containing protein, partial [Clostridia bacterium]|nr:FtsQ-type POTRA domain-containing protein [Clostridia bacterium]